MIRIPGTETSRTIDLGADNWILSYHLSALLGAFHVDNEYDLVTDEKDPDTILFLENRISTEKSMKNVTLINCDYDDLPLEKHSYDLVILNGSTMLTSL